MWRKKLPYYFRGIELEDIKFSGESADAEFVIWLCTRYLKKKPGTVPVVLMRAQCYEVLKKTAELWADVELAYALDDTFIPAIYTFAMSLIDRNDIDRALPLLALIKDHPAAGGGVDASLSEICMRQAKANIGCEYQLRAWLSNFDNIRYANAYLFKLTYSNAPELICAQEHKFWADTLAPIKANESISESARKPNNLGMHKGVEIERKKIGYWGSDFREHSVRYFSRPLIENHDHNNWEVFIFDDNFIKTLSDRNTQAFIAAAEHYYDTSNWSDDQVVDFILSHKLDVLMDITGHTSANRMHRWQQRLAQVMITGLAYPPTTGLSSIDYKIVDVHMLSEDSHRYYAEKQLVMPESFWCFDPMEDAYYNNQPPYKSSEYLTFACMGNSAKISEPMMQAWAQILRVRFNVRLLIVSPSFADHMTVRNFTEHMNVAGIDLSRLTCRTTFDRNELWQRYAEVDLILDTFPFNGGTTSCWATYAGVPVLTLAGNSLSSCMGKSIMTNLGFSEFIAESIDDYVDKAINIASNPEIIDRFRSCARSRFVASSLGDGKKFTKQFEAECERLLDSPAQIPEPDVPPLPLKEMLRRAKMVWYGGNISACERMLALCRRHYSDAIEIDELHAETLLGQKEFTQLGELNANIPSSHRLMHLGAMCDVASGNYLAASEKARAFCEMKLANSDVATELQMQLWEKWLEVQMSNSLKKFTTSIAVCSTTTKAIFWLIHEDETKFKEQKEEIQSLLLDNCIELTFEYVCKHERAESYNMLLKKYAEANDLVIVLREGVEPVDSNIIQALESTLQTADVVGAAGGLRWEQKDWTLDIPDFKAWGLMRPSLLNDTLFELHFAGVDTRPVVDGAVVLDGKLLAFYPGRLSTLLFDDDMGDAGLWIEEDWCHRAYLAGNRLAVHRALGVVMHPTSEMQSFHTAAGQKNLLTRLKFDPLRLPNVNHDVCTVQVKSKEMGVLIGKLFTQQT